MERSTQWHPKVGELVIELFNNNTYTYALERLVLRADE